MFHVYLDCFSALFVKVETCDFVNYVIPSGKEAY